MICASSRLQNARKSLEKTQIIQKFLKIIITSDFDLRLYREWMIWKKRYGGNRLRAVSGGGANSFPYQRVVNSGPPLNSGSRSNWEKKPKIIMAPQEIGIFGKLALIVAPQDWALIVAPLDVFWLRPPSAARKNCYFWHIFASFVKGKRRQNPQNFLACGAKGSHTLWFWSRRRRENFF